MTSLTHLPDAEATEIERLRKLDELALMAEPAHPQFAKVCHLAANMFGVPYAFVSLIDATQAHVLAHHGLGPGHMPRRQAMCDVAVTEGRPLVVPELTQDPRFKDTPLVTGEAAMRFYAGVPLEVAPGVCLGAFCIADRSSREFTADELASLESLSALVVEQIDHHARRQNLSRLALQLAARQAILAQTEDLAKVGGFELDPADDSMIWSEGLCRLLKVSPDDKPGFARFLADLGGEHGIFGSSLRRLGANGPVDLEADFGEGDDRRSVHLHAEFHVPADGGRKIVGIIQDVTERTKVVAALEWAASHDPLTNLLNRSAFTAAVETAMAGAVETGGRVALIMVDIDRFKLVNDTLGHDVGDAVLRAVADRLKAAGSRCTVGRIGGDEFAVLVANYAAEGVIAALATRLLLELRQPLHHRLNVLATRATLGIAVREPGVVDAGDLFKAADLALYHAKDAGRDGFAFFQSTMRADLAHRQDRLADARAAVDDERIEPYYQPKICLESGRIAGFEALLRWHHPRRGLCAPGEIADAFGEPRLAMDIGRTMLRRIAADMVTWRAAGVLFRHVGLNVAEAELSSDDYGKRVLACLAEHDLPPEVLELEVIESVFLGQTTGIARKLEALAAAGIAIALDDFGTGYASLTHLKRYPVSAIKIDRSFITDIERDRHDAMIVDAMTTLANSLGIAVVAEGIETASQAQHLRSRRCTMGQGFLFAKPMPASRVPHFIKTWTARVPKKSMAVAG